MTTELLELGKSEEVSDEFVIAQGEEAHLWLKGDNNGEVTGASNATADAAALATRSSLLVDHPAWTITLNT